MFWMNFGIKDLIDVLLVASLVSLFAAALLWRARTYLPAELDRYSDAA